MNIVVTGIILTLVVIWCDGVYTSLDRIAKALERIANEKEKKEK